MLTWCDCKLDWIAIGPNRHHEVVSIAIKISSRLPCSRAYSTGFWLWSYGRVFDVFALVLAVYAEQLDIMPITLAATWYQELLIVCTVLWDLVRDHVRVLSRLIRLLQSQCERNLSRLKPIESRSTETDCNPNRIWIQCERASSMRFSMLHSYSTCTCMYSMYIQ